LGKDQQLKRTAAVTPPALIGRLASLPGAHEVD
jgi:hypothetical protein